jgi:hypothetical protein
LINVKKFAVCPFTFLTVESMRSLSIINIRSLLKWNTKQDINISCYG